MTTDTPPSGNDGLAAPQTPVGTPRSVGLTIFITIITFGVWTLVWSYKNGEELKVYRSEGLGGVLYLVVTLIFMPITMFMMANEVETMYVEAGEEPKITTLWGLWFLLPLIGYIVWYVRMQHAINSFWQARGATGKPGLA